MLRRLAWAAVLFLVVTLYTYVLFFMIDPITVQGGATQGEGGEGSTLANSVGVHGSFLEAYGQFLTKVVQGDLGESFYSRREVTRSSGRG